MPQRKKVFFISSTILDLKDLRSFLSYELHAHGFKTLLSEEGTIPADSSKHTYDACIEAAKKCDYLIAVIDGRFGGEVPGTNKSITLTEVDSALKASKQVRIFVRQGVWDAKEILRPYFKSKIKFRSSKIISDARVLDVIDQLRRRKVGNWIFQFNTPQDILRILSEQFKFDLRTPNDAEKDKLDKILARRFLAEFNSTFVDRFINDIQTEHILIDDTEVWDYAISVFLPRPMRFAGMKSSTLFDKFMNNAVELNNQLPLVFGTSRNDKFYTARIPLSQLGHAAQEKKLRKVKNLAVRTHGSWVELCDFIRTKWPDLIIAVIKNAEKGEL